MSCVDNAGIRDGVHIRNAYILFDSQDGAVIDNLDCPWKAQPIWFDEKLADKPDGKRFLEAVRGRGSLGPLPKYVVVDGTVNKANGKSFLIAVSKFREVAFDPAEKAKRINETRGCDKSR